MVGNTSRVLDSVVIGEETTAGTEASAYDVTVLGDIISCSLKTTENNTVLGGIKGVSNNGHLPSKIVNLKVTPAGSITFHPHGLQFYKYVISDYTEGTGTYTMANDTTALPDSLSIKGTYNETEGVRHLGCYLNNMRISVNDDSILTVTADIVSLFSDTFTGTVSYDAPSGSPLTYADGTFTFGGNEWDLQSLNNTYNPKFTQKWGFNTKAAGKKRFPSSIYRGGKAAIPFDGVANVENITNELEAMQGGSSAADKKTNSTMVINFVDDDAETHTITMSGQMSEYDITQTDSEENAKTIIFRGDCTDFSVAGTRP
jgi:hypothetical protein